MKMQFLLPWSRARGPPGVRTCCWFSGRVLKGNRGGNGNWGEERGEVECGAKGGRGSNAGGQWRRGSNGGRMETEVWEWGIDAGNLGGKPSHGELSEGVGGTFGRLTQPPTKSYRIATTQRYIGISGGGMGVPGGDGEGGGRGRRRWGATGG